MNKYETAKPIGLQALCEQVENICQNARVYKCGLRPPHMIVPLSAGCGRTTFVEYMTDMYKAHGIFDFSGSLDDYIEVTVDGSSSRSIAQAFDNFKAAADYRNAYGNVAVVNAEDMAKYLNAPQFADFMKEVKELCRFACVVFFVSSEPSVNEEKLIEKLTDGIGQSKIRRVTPEKYTAQDMCCLVEKTVGEHGVLIENQDLFHTALTEMVLNFTVCTVKQAVEMAEELIHYADFSHFTPTVDEKALTVLAETWNKTGERKETK